MAFLGDRPRGLDQHRPSSPQAQAEQARHGCKIAENIRRAREYRRPRKAPVCPPGRLRTVGSPDPLAIKCDRIR